MPCKLLEALFLQAHFAPNSKFNFHKYIRRSMEDDYKKVLGIRCLSFSHLNTKFKDSKLLEVLSTYCFMFPMQYSLMDFGSHFLDSKCLRLVISWHLIIVIVLLLMLINSIACYKLWNNN